MQVILTKTVDTLGEQGSVKEVAEGYARNFLFPKSLAVVATPGALEDLERRRKRLAVKAEKEHQDNMAKVAKIEQLGELHLEANAGDDGKLFGSVTTKELARIVSEQTGLHIERKSLTLNSPINRVGDYQLTIKFSPRASAVLAISVRAAAQA